MDNFIPKDAIERVEANKNAVLCVIQYVECPQDDDTIGYQKIVHIECKDPRLLAMLRNEARTACQNLSEDRSC